jgi:hypothetical protein
MLPHHQKFYALAADAAATTLPGLSAISYKTNYLAVALAFTSKIDRATKALGLINFKVKVLRPTKNSQKRQRYSAFGANLWFWTTDIYVILL